MKHSLHIDILYSSSAGQCNALTMKLSNPVKIVDTDQAGFQVSGWKSLIERHSLKEIINETMTVMEKKKDSQVNSQNDITTESFQMQ